MCEIKYNVQDIYNELKTLKVWEKFCDWAYSLYPNLHHSQQCFMYCYEVFKLNESFFLSEWQR
ncbi:hypothetical protein D7X41_19675 [Salmonella enterica]|nr:hypothetical protein [Salmonella enterica]